MSNALMTNNVNKPNKIENNLASNLKMLFEEQKLNINQLSQLLDIPFMTIKRLLTGETTDPRISTIMTVAEYFGVTVDTLMGKNTQSTMTASKETKPLLIPILRWEAIEKINSVDDLDLTAWSEWQPISLNEETVISDKTFALESRPSMSPRYPKETVFIIDPETKATDGDIVLVKFKENNGLTLRQLVIDPPEQKLEAIVPGSNTINYSKREHQIIGVNLLTMLYNPKIYN